MIIIIFTHQQLSSFIEWTNWTDEQKTCLSELWRKITLESLLSEYFYRNQQIWLYVNRFKNKWHKLKRPVIKLEKTEKCSSRLCQLNSSVIKELQSSLNLDSYTKVFIDQLNRLFFFPTFWLGRPICRLLRFCHYFGRIHFRLWRIYYFSKRWRLVQYWPYTFS